MSAPSLEKPFRRGLHRAFGWRLRCWRFRRSGSRSRRVALGAADDLEDLRHSLSPLRSRHRLLLPGVVRDGCHPRWKRGEENCRRLYRSHCRCSRCFSEQPWISSVSTAFHSGSRSRLFWSRARSTPEATKRAPTRHRCERRVASRRLLAHPSRRRPAPQVFDVQARGARPGSDGCHDRWRACTLACVGGEIAERRRGGRVTPRKEVARHRALEDAKSGPVFDGRVDGRRQRPLSTQARLDRRLP